VAANDSVETLRLREPLLLEPEVTRDGRRQ
jgi:hypothetical protein